MEKEFEETVESIADAANNVDAQDVIDDLSAQSANASQQLPQDSSWTCFFKTYLFRIESNRIESSLSNSVWQIQENDVVEFENTDLLGIWSDDDETDPTASGHVDDEPEDEDLIEDLEQQLNAKRFVGLKSEQFREKKINAKISVRNVNLQKIGKIELDVISFYI